MLASMERKLSLKTFMFDGGESGSAGEEPGMLGGFEETSPADQLSSRLYESKHVRVIAHGEPLLYTA